MPEKSSLSWRPMAATDLPAVMTVAAKVHPDYPEGEAVFAERLTLHPAGCLCLGLSSLQGMCEGPTPPPCGEGQGWGAQSRSEFAGDEAASLLQSADHPVVRPPSPYPSPQGGREEFHFGARLPSLPEDEGVLGYVLSHPWRLGQVPALDSLLGTVPDVADAYYIHDLALLPAARGGGAASGCVDRLAAHALTTGFARMALVAVGNSAGFWRRQGLREAHDEALARKLASYDDAARYMIRDLNDDGRTQ
jgi:GNAT superfamily N-acetyltransferase